MAPWLRPAFRRNTGPIVSVFWGGDGPLGAKYTRSNAAGPGVIVKRLSAKYPGPLAILVLVLLVACAFWKLVFTRQFAFVETPDIAQQVVPWLQVQAAALSHGHIALWDPYLFGGQPLIGQMQPGVTSPITYLLLILPLRNGYLRPEFVNYWFVLIHCLGALFAYWLLRDLQCSRTASVVGGLFFAISGFNGNISCALCEGYARWVTPQSLEYSWVCLGFLATIKCRSS